MRAFINVVFACSVVAGCGGGTNLGGTVGAGGAGGASTVGTGAAGGSAGSTGGAGGSFGTGGSDPLGNACSPSPANGPGTTANLPRAPQNHRPESTMCSGTVGPCPADDAGIYGCATCVSSASGVTCFTTPDAGEAEGRGGCLKDTDCDPILPGGVCSCDGMTQRQFGPSTNACIFGNCRVDGDCGSGGYCSPSRATRCASRGVTGHYCHTTNDHCLDDSDCAAAGCASSWCIYQPEVGYWACSYGVCNG